MPAGKPGAFKVFYQGKPLAKAKLELIAESGWKREFKTDEQGAVDASLLWRGSYVIEVQHADATPGKLGEESYDLVRCASTLFFRVADHAASHKARRSQRFPLRVRLLSRLPPLS